METEEYEGLNYQPVETEYEYSSEACDICDIDCGDSYACSNCTADQRDDDKHVYFIMVD